MLGLATLKSCVSTCSNKTFSAQCLHILGEQEQEQQETTQTENKRCCEPNRNYR